MKALLWTLLLLCASIAWAWLADPFVGTWEGDGLTLVLRSSGQGYSGSATLEGVTAAVTASKVSASKIQGTYTVQGESASFTGVLKDGQLVIEADGETMTLWPKGAPSLGSAETLKDTGWGIEFKPPANWLGKQVDGMFVLGSETKKGAIFILPVEVNSVQELRDGAKEGLEDEGVVLKLSGTPKTFGANGLSAEFEGKVDGKDARAAVIGLVSPHGVGAVVVAIVEKASFGAEYRTLAETVAKSIKFSKSPMPDFVQDWKKSFVDTRLTYMSSYSSMGGGGSGGSSSREVIELYSSGRCDFRSSSSISIDAGAYGHSASRSEGAGVWEVVAEGQTAFLRLSLDDGTVKTFKLAYEDKKLYLEGYRYFWTSLSDGGVHLRVTGLARLPLS